jgi:hypothetical protein
MSARGGGKKKGAKKKAPSWQCNWCQTSKTSKHHRWRPTRRGRSSSGRATTSSPAPRAPKSSPSAPTVARRSLRARRSRTRAKKGNQPLLYTRGGGGKQRGRRSGSSRRGAGRLPPCPSTSSTCVKARLPKVPARGKNQVFPTKLSRPSSRRYRLPARSRLACRTRSRRRPAVLGIAKIPHPSRASRP